jgi:hypothetical protein
VQRGLVLAVKFGQNACRARAARHRDLCVCATAALDAVGRRVAGPLMRAARGARWVFAVSDVGHHAAAAGPLDAVAHRRRGGTALSPRRSGIDDPPLACSPRSSRRTHASPVPSLAALVVSRAPRLRRAIDALPALLIGLNMLLIGGRSRRLRRTGRWMARPPAARPRRPGRRAGGLLRRSQRAAGRARRRAAGVIALGLLVLASGYDAGEGGDASRHLLGPSLGWLQARGTVLLSSPSTSAVDL